MLTSRMEASEAKGVILMGPINEGSGAARGQHETITGYGPSEHWFGDLGPIQD